MLKNLAHSTIMYCTRSILLYMIVIVNCEWFCVLWLWRMIAIPGNAGKRMSGSVCKPEAWGHQVSIDPVTRHSDSWLQQLGKIFYTPTTSSPKRSLLSSSLVLLDKTLVDDVLGCRSWLVCQHVPRAGGGSQGSLGRPGLARHAGARPSHPGWRAEICPPRRTGHFVPDF